MGILKSIGKAFNEASGVSDSIDAQLKMAKMNNEFNEIMYNRYQSPQALMRQYEEAGLNPNLIYGGAASSHASIVADHGTNAGHGGDMLGGLFSTVLNAYSTLKDNERRDDALDSQLKTADAQRSYIKANTVKSLVDAEALQQSVDAWNDTLTNKNDNSVTGKVHRLGFKAGEKLYEVLHKKENIDIPILY